MKNKLILLTGLLIPTLRSSVPVLDSREQYTFMVEWNDFARPITQYIHGVEGGVIDYESLKQAMRAWRKLEHDQEWDQIK